MRKISAKVGCRVAFAVGQLGVLPHQTGGTVNDSAIGVVNREAHGIGGNEIRDFADSQQSAENVAVNVHIALRNAQVNILIGIVSHQENIERERFRPGRREKLREILLRPSKEFIGDSHIICECRK